MRSSTITSLGNPGSFDLSDKDDPLYYIARASHEQSMQFYNLSSNSFEYRQEESTDVGAIQTAFDGYLTSFKAWIDSALTARAEGESIPALPAFAALATAGIPNILIAMIIKFGIQILMEWIRGKLNPQSEDIDELVDVLKRAMLYNSDTEDEYAIMSAVADQPIEIMLNNTNNIEDVSFSR